MDPAVGGYSLCGAWILQLGATVCVVHGSCSWRLQFVWCMDPAVGGYSLCGAWILQLEATVCVVHGSCSWGLQFVWCMDPAVGGYSLCGVVLHRTLRFQAESVAAIFVVNSVQCFALAVFASLRMLPLLPLSLSLPVSSLCTTVSVSPRVLSV